MARRLAPLALVVALAYSGWVATTTPFTVGSDVAVVVGFVGLGVVAGAALRRRHLGRASATEDRVEEAAPGRLRLWLVPLGALVIVELVTYFAGSANRHAYPTLSSLSDAAFRSTAAKAVVVLAWLGLGWELVRR